MTVIKHYYLLYKDERNSFHIYISNAQDLYECDIAKYKHDHKAVLLYKQICKIELFSYRNIYASP